MSQLEFLTVVRWTMRELAAWCRQHSPRHIMDFKRELQQAVTTYRRTHRFDAVCEKTLAIISKIEKWMRDAFVATETIQAIKGNPRLSPAAAKNLARNAWEKYNRKASF